MCGIRSLAILLSGFLAVPFFLLAQAQKAGLWEVTTTQTFQQSPFPAGTPNPMGGPHTNQVCMTQQQIDKYGSIPPQTRGSCQVANVVKKADGMTAELQCTGAMSGKGTVDAKWTDSEHAKTKVHFNGEMRMGQNTKPVEWTIEANAVFKSADCGNVKPLATPPDR